jgi:hypothetical protein
VPVDRVIWGRVFDAASSPVTGARVSLDQHDGTAARDVVVAVTTGDGRFTLGGTTLGAWHVTAERNGYEPALFCCRSTSLMTSCCASIAR